MAAAGNAATWAVQYAVSEINAAGGIRGVPVKVTAYDDANSATQAVSVAAKVIPGSLVLLGPTMLIQMWQSLNSLLLTIFWISG